ncbi:MAG: glycoside hydrolase family 9 protein [Chitinispirillales bacterium]|nr:glycoside hydrolase family 9 protein [Chitinispirillales bacterium]
MKKHTLIFSRTAAVALLAVIISTLTMKACVATSTPMNVALMDNIRLNQIGYYPKSHKIAVIIHKDGEAVPTGFEIVSLSGDRAAFTGELSEMMEWAESGEKGWQADFSALNVPGSYKIVLTGDGGQIGKSYPFIISNDVYKNVANASMRTYYFQRCSHELTAEFAGAQWARAAGHPDTAVSFHASSGRTEGTLMSPGGWYDAGDFGKYVVNSGITVGTLLAFYENFPDYFPDKSLNIPESGNNRPDILDEVKINLDWMKTMQDDDGGVFFKLTTLEFPGYIMPEDDYWERFAIGKSTTSALNFAATMAMAGRIFMPFDSAYAKDCIDRAGRAWDWAVKNPDIPFTNPPDVKTGEYRDVKFDDEFIWAAAELFITTGDTRYADFLSDKDITYKHEPSWQNVHALAPLSLSTIENGLGAEQLAAVRNSIIATADRWVGEMSKHLYRIPNTNFIWGSNSNFANMGIGIIYAYKLTNDKKYLLAAAEIADYLLGKNAIGISFMTAFGSRYAANPHHRHIVAAKELYGQSPEEQRKRQTAENGADVVIPGFLVGGPNVGHQDSVHGVTYTYTLPAKSFEDVYKSYASNEVAINWNAPATFLFGAVDALMRRE